MDLEFFERGLPFCVPRSRQYDLGGHLRSAGGGVHTMREQVLLVEVNLELV
jgi:hypothetical protein